MNDKVNLVIFEGIDGSGGAEAEKTAENLSDP